MSAPAPRIPRATVSTRTLLWWAGSSVVCALFWVAVIWWLA